MPLPDRSLCWLLCAALPLAACRPGDAPKEPVEPTEPTVSLVAPLHPAGGVSLAMARRGQAVAKL